ncbi:Kynurenine formamidase [Caulifigura coniformis]|uniref:Kynurenine formamidase n=1 Tax=Caulifigura coniformis TaxID=2527983 RepID=A0A517SKM9_9PLAN|nr:cyclase family protein [Caulifigura coniformis]QDT56674.1 Kynurenine formamidase [Caulifigura coniformis]
MRWILVIALLPCRSVLGQAPLPSPFDDKGARIVDLAWPLNEKSPFWPGDNYTPFRLETIATLKEDGVSSKAFSMPEHLGTHIDAPNHFENDRPGVDAIPAERLFGPGVVIDLAVKCEMDPDAMLTVADIADWEKSHGAIPRGAIVLLQTGWGRHATNPARYQNRDVMGKMHFPGFSAEAAEWLVREREVRGIGLDTLSIDRGLSTKFEVHHVINKAGRYGLENVAHLDQLPATGFGLIVAPIKIEGGTGGPTRIWAVVPKGPGEPAR